MRTLVIGLAALLAVAGAVLPKPARAVQAPTAASLAAWLDLAGHVLSQHVSSLALAGLRQAVAVNAPATLTSAAADQVLGAKGAPRAALVHVMAALVIMNGRQRRAAGAVQALALVFALAITLVGQSPVNAAVARALAANVADTPAVALTAASRHAAVVNVTITLVA